MEKLDSNIEETNPNRPEVCPGWTTNRSLRKNVSIDGRKETKTETRNDCKENVNGMFPQKLGLDGIEIKRAHLVKSNNRDNNTNIPRIIVV